MNFTLRIIIYVLSADFFTHVNGGSISLFLAAGRFVGVSVFPDAVAMWSKIDSDSAYSTGTSVSNVPVGAF